MGALSGATQHGTSMRSAAEPCNVSARIMGNLILGEPSAFLRAPCMCWVLPIPAMPRRRAGAGYDVKLVCRVSRCKCPQFASISLGQMPPPQALNSDAFQRECLLSREERASQRRVVREGFPSQLLRCVDVAAFCGACASPMCGLLLAAGGVRLSLTHRVLGLHVSCRSVTCRGQKCIIVVPSPVARSGARSGGA